MLSPVVWGGHTETQCEAGQTLTHTATERKADADCHTAQREMVDAHEIRLKVDAHCNRAWGDMTVQSYMSIQATGSMCYVCVCVCVALTLEISVNDGRVVTMQIDKAPHNSLTLSQTSR